MCSKNVLEEIQEKVYRGAKEVLGDKLEKVLLFGSYARGDFDDESDIDFFVLADIAQEDASRISREIDDHTGNLDLEYCIVVCVHVVSTSLFNRFRNVMPYFMNVVKEGRELSYA